MKITLTSIFSPHIPITTTTRVEMYIYMQEKLEAKLRDIARDLRVAASISFCIVSVGKNVT